VIQQGTDSRWTWKLVLIAYAVLWTAMLIVPHPLDFLLLRTIVADTLSDASLLDKIIHGGGYVVLTLLALVSAGAAADRPWPLAALAGACSAHGAVTELLQLVTPDREGDVVDWLADSGGVVLAVVLWKALRRA
jgi:VanZ family protein